MIKNDGDLFDWLFTRLLEADPVIRCTPGLPRLAEAIRQEIQHEGFLSRSDDDAWRATFSSLLTKVSVPGEVKCSAKVIDWIAALLAEAATCEDHKRVSLQRINRILIYLLDLEGRFLLVERWRSATGIRSTKRCEDEFSVKIKVQEAC